MTDHRTDQIAREAARLIETGSEVDVRRAIAKAAEILHAHDAPLPGTGRVRMHAQAMMMQSIGQAAYEDSQHRVWRVAEEMLAVLEMTIPDAAGMLVGRAAEGHFDAGVTVHLRLYTRADIGDIARALVEFGYEEPQFQTAETRHGRLNQLKLQEEGVDVVLTRVMPELQSQSKHDLFTSKPIESIDLKTLRRRLDER